MNLGTGRAGAFASILVTLGLVLAACSASSSTSGQLEGTEWILNAYDQAGALTIVPETLFADAEFDGRRVTGNSGCNQFQATYQAGARTILIGATSGTLMACDPATMTFEQTFLTLLQAGRFYAIRNDTLTINDSLNHPALVFDAAPTNPLLGRWDVAAFAVPPSTVKAPLAGTTLNVVFGLASVGGSSGCNSFNGSYEINGNAIRISRLASTQIACPQDVLDQESQFLSAFQGVSFIDIVGTGVNLTDRKGSLVVALSRPVPEPGASPAASVPAGASSAPTASPAPTATPAATATPAPSTTPAPTESPNASAILPPSLRPSAPPPIVIPSTATCDLPAASGAPVVAKIIYPGTWFTVTEPADLVCRYFDPAAINVPSDPTTLQTAIMANSSATAYADAVTAATDPLNWTVARQGEIAVRGSKATCLDETALTDTGGVPVGTARFVCLADVGKAGTVSIWATGTAGDPAYLTKAGAVWLMTVLSTFVPTTS